MNAIPCGLFLASCAAALAATDVPASAPNPNTPAPKGATASH
jgi:hypothetical protein